MRDTIIVMREVTKTFVNGEDYLKALDRVSFEVCRGEFVAVMGASGSGKTTLGILENLYQLTDTLSGGQQQRAAIARALLYRPPVILADEPTGSLDRRTGTAVLEQMRDMCTKNNQTLVVVTHEERIGRMADRLICLEDGEVVSLSLIHI